MWRDGFLGYRASFMLDFVVVALVLIVPLLLFSLYAVKYRRQYTLHRNLQLLLLAVLGVAIVAFEIDVQWLHGGWENLVAKRTPPLSPAQLSQVRTVLLVHLVFAISTPLLWGVTLYLALKHMPRPPAPCAHSLWHRRLGWLATLDLVLTSITGLMFYYAAFVAPT